MSSWSLGPEHPNYGADLAYGPPPYESQRMQARAAPMTFRCSQCGAGKPSGRALCPCGAFQKDRTGQP